MRKFTFYFKSLLVAVCLIVGSANVWADAGDVITNANIDFSNAISDGKVVGTVNSITIGGASYIDGDNWLRLKETGDCSITIPEAQRAESKDVVHIQFKKGWGNKNGMGSGFSLKDADGEIICNYTYARWGGGSNTLNISMDGLVGAQLNNAPIKARYTLFDVIVDYAARTITSTVECVNTDGKGTHKSETFYATLTNTNPIATFNTWGYNVGSNTDRADAIDDIVITTTKGDYSVDEYDYTVNWVYDEEIVKTAIRQGEEDADIALLPSDDDPFWESAKKYFYVSSDVAGKKVSSDGSTVVTITVRTAENWHYTVKAVDGGSTELKTLLVGDVVEGETASYGYPQYIAIDGTLYKSAAQGSNPWWGKSFVPVSDSEEQTITYTAQSTTNVVFCEEAENIAALTVVSGGNTDIRASNRKGAYSGADFEHGGFITTLPAGTYKIWGATYGNAGATLRIYAGNESTQVFSIATNGNPVNTEGENFTLTEPTDLVLVGGNGGNSPKVLDYIYIQQIVESVTVTAASYATYVPSYDLDFSTTEIKAYKVKITGKETATLTRVDKVPAGAPVLLYKEGGATENIPVTTGAAAIPSSENNLVAGTGAAVPSQDGIGNVNMILNNGASGIGFYFANDQIVAANRAYLQFAIIYAPDIPAGAKSLKMIFADEATEVVAPAAADVEEEEVLYNMAGVQVDKNFKGFVINQKGVKRFNK